MSNMGLFKAMKREGIEVCVTTVGDKYVNEAMVANGYVLGGEQSGHIIFSKHATTGDGILTALMLMEVILEKKRISIQMENQVREISLRHLFWKVILGWKCLIVCAVLFAILLPGVKYAKDAQAYKAAQQPQNDAQEVTFTKDEQQQIDDVKSLQILLDKNSAYMQDSILMNIDPYQEHVLELQYYIDSDYTYNYSKDNKKDYTSAVTNAYVEYAVNGLNQKEIWDGVNTKVEDKYLTELISASSDSDNTFSVRVKFMDEKGLQSVSGKIQKALNARHEDVANRIGSHKLVLVSENYQVQTDSDLASSQDNVTGLIKSYREQITTLTSTMTEDQLKVVDDASILL